jgi:hypothetical protein
LTHQGDFASCTGSTDAIATGTEGVLVNKFPAARNGELCAHGGTVADGSGDVLIGGPSVGPGGLPVVRDADGKIHLGKAITIEGTPEFQAQVVNRLATIGTRPSGRQVLSSIDGSGHSMKMIEYKGDNSFCGPEDFAAATAAGQPVYDGSGKPVNSWFGFGSQQTGTGTGSDTVLELNPNLTLPNKKGDPVPNDAILFHEMNHGSHQMNGTYDGSPTPGYDTKEEQTTISTGKPSEAGYLKEGGYPWQRTDHDLTFAPNP